MEYCPRGTLDTLLHHSARRFWNPQKLVALLIAVVRGMVHLHAQRPPLLHRDLKPGNIFLGELLWGCCVEGTRVAAAAVGTALAVAPCGPTWEPGKIFVGERASLPPDIHGAELWSDKAVFGGQGFSWR